MDSGAIHLIGNRVTDAVEKRGDISVLNGNINRPLKYLMFPLVYLF